MKERQGVSGPAELQRRVLAAVANDLESFEDIAGELARVSGKAESADEIAASLEFLIAEGLVGAYLLHAEAPYITPVEPRVAEVKTHWMYITEKGCWVLHEGESPEDAPRWRPPEIRDSA